MAEKNDGAKAEGSHHPSRPLSIGQRRAAASVGAVALAGGAVGSFLDGTNSIGIPALIAIGAALTYVGITGQTLTRIKIGEHEVELAKQVVASDSAPENLRVKAAEVLEEADVPLARTTKRAVDEVLGNFQDGRDYEAAVANAIWDSLPKGASSHHRPVDLGWDHMVQSMDRRTSVPIDIRYFSESNAANLGRRIRETRHRLRDSAMNVAIMITNVDMARQEKILKMAEEEDGRTLRLVTWQGPSDNPKLVEVLNEMIWPDDTHE